MTLGPFYNKVFVGKRVVEPDIIGIWQKGDDHPLTVPNKTRLNTTKMPDKEVMHLCRGAPLADAVSLPD